MTDLVTPEEAKEIKREEYEKAVSKSERKRMIRDRIEEQRRNKELEDEYELS